MTFNNTTLVGKTITLVPLAVEHAAGLYAASQVKEIWNYMIRPVLSSVEDAEGFITAALNDAQNGSQFPFIVKTTADDVVIGSTRFLDIQPTNRALEVGWTFINPEYWGHNVAVEMKYLMFKEAFESGFVRVLLKTDSRNIRAQKHIEKVGGIKEGVLRKHMLAGDGVQRNTVMYSVIDDEWPETCAALEKLLNL